MPHRWKEYLTSWRTIDDATVSSAYGTIGRGRALLKGEDAKAAGIVYLEAGTHKIDLPNGGILTVCASPYTASKSSGWGSKHNPQHAEHNWNISSSVDVAMTHGPAHGILDMTDSRQRAGSKSLFAAISRAQPRIHCFGHIHDAWGAKAVTWRPDLSEELLHLTDIDNDESRLIESLATSRPGKFDTPETVAEKATK